MPLDRCQQQRQQLPIALRPQVHLRAEPAPTAPEGFRLRIAAAPPDRVLVGADRCAVHVMDTPVELPCDVGQSLECGEQGVPDPGGVPAIEAGGDRLPRTEAGRQVALRSTGAHEPQIPSRASRWSFAGWAV